jgi:hypothetical protein
MLGVAVPSARIAPEGWQNFARQLSPRFRRAAYAIDTSIAAPSMARHIGSHYGAYKDVLATTKSMGDWDHEMHVSCVSAASEASGKGNTRGILSMAYSEISWYGLPRSTSRQTGCLNVRCFQTSEKVGGRAEGVRVVTRIVAYPSTEPRIRSEVNGVRSLP